MAHQFKPQDPRLFIFLMMIYFYFMCINALPVCVCVPNANPVLGGCLYFALSRIYVAILSYIRITKQQLHAMSCGWGGQDSTKHHPGSLASGGRWSDIITVRE